MSEQTRTGPGRDLDRAVRQLGVRGQQPKDVPAEAAAENSRTDRARLVQARDRRLDGRRRDLVVVAQARVRSVEQPPQRGDVAAPQNRS